MVSGSGVVGVDGGVWSGNILDLVVVSSGGGCWW